MGDYCPALANADQADTDGDGVGNACDNAPSLANADHAACGCAPDLEALKAASAAAEAALKQQVDSDD